MTTRIVSKRFYQNPWVEVMEEIWTNQVEAWPRCLRIGEVSTWSRQSWDEELLELNCVNVISHEPPLLHLTARDIEDVNVTKKVPSSWRRLAVLTEDPMLMQLATSQPNRWMQLMYIIEERTICAWIKGRVFRDKLLHLVFRFCLGLNYNAQQQKIAKRLLVVFYVVYHSYPLETICGDWDTDFHWHL